MARSTPHDANTESKAFKQWAATERNGKFQSVEFYKMSILETPTWGSHCKVFTNLKIRFVILNESQHNVRVKVWERYSWVPNFTICWKEPSLEKASFAYDSHPLNIMVHACISLRTIINFLIGKIVFVYLALLPEVAPILNFTYPMPRQGGGIFCMFI